MMFTKLAFATALVAAVSAVDIPISVGGNASLTFNPPSVTANVGDNLVFSFQSKNHSVWQSTFAAPCTSMTGGFTNAYFPVNATNALLPQVTIQVTNTTPIWFYCPQTNPANHCELGMVGAVNPTADKTFQQFQAAAKALAPAGNGTSSAVPSASSAAASPSSTATKNGAISLGAGKLLVAVAAIITLAL